MRDFLTCLLTKRELNDITLRWKLVELLNQGHTQRDIADSLHVSLCKITRGARELKKRRSAFKRVLETNPDAKRQKNQKNVSQGEPQ